MDRFIDELVAAPASAAKHLKSSMDRFIDSGNITYQQYSEI